MPKPISEAGAIEVRINYIENIISEGCIPTDWLYCNEGNRACDGGTHQVKGLRFIKCSMPSCQAVAPIL